MWKRRQDENRKRENDGLGWGDGSGGGAKQNSGELGGITNRQNLLLHWTSGAGRTKEGRVQGMRN